GGQHPAAANRTYILAGAEVTTLNELVRLVADVAGVPPPKLHVPVWPVWMAGAICEAVCVPLRIQPSLYRRRVDFFTKSRAFDIMRARTEIGYAPQVGLRDGIGRTLEWYRHKGWLCGERRDDDSERCAGAGRHDRARAGSAVRCGDGQPPEVRGARRRTSRTPRTARVRVRDHARAAAGRRAGARAPQDALPAAPRCLRPQRRLRTECRAATSSQD